MTAATLTRDQTEGMDDVAAFANALTEKELDAAIDAKCRLFDVEVLRAGKVVAKELNVRAVSSCAALEQVEDTYGLNYAFRVVPQ